MEATVEWLYQILPNEGGTTRKDDGTVVACVRRATEITVVLVGVVFYITHRRMVQQVYAEAEEAAEMEEE
jgi:hypothetical protein